MAGFLAGMGASLAASGLNFLASAQSAKDAYKYSLALQNHQNRWMEKMSNSAHQREVKDLRAAGLNPILSATGGSGASTPSAGSATMGAVTPDLSAGISTALDFKRLKNETELKDSTKSLNKWQENKVIHEADVAHHSAAKLREETQLLQEWGPKLKEMEYLTFKNNIENANAVTAAQVRNLDSGSNLNNSAALLNAYSAKSSKIDTDWSTEHPFLYGLGRSGSSIPVIGAVGAGIAGVSTMRYRQNELDLRTKQFEQSSKVRPSHSRRR